MIVSLMMRSNVYNTYISLPANLIINYQSESTVIRQCYVERTQNIKRPFV